MARQAIKFRPPNLAPLRAEAVRYKRAIRDASLFATDLGGQRAFRRQQAMIKSVGLGNLSKAVGWTSAQKKGQRGATRSAERRAGNESVSTCRSRWSPYT